MVFPPKAVDGAVENTHTHTHTHTHTQHTHHQKETKFRCGLQALITVICFTTCLFGSGWPWAMASKMMGRRQGRMPSSHVILEASGQKLPASLLPLVLKALASSFMPLPKPHPASLGETVRAGSLLFAVNTLLTLGFPGGSDGKESSCNAGDSGSVPWVGKTPLEKEVATHSSIPASGIPWIEEPWGAAVHVVAKESDTTVWLKNNNTIQSLYHFPN